MIEDEQHEDFQVLDYSRKPIELLNINDRESRESINQEMYIVRKNCLQCLITDSYEEACEYIYKIIHETCMYLAPVYHYQVERSVVNENSNCLRMFHITGCSHFCLFRYYSVLFEIELVKCNSSDNCLKTVSGTVTGIDSELNGQFYDLSSSCNIL
jgi:hypothetical protein